MTLLDRIDDTLAAHDATHAETTGHPWPGRVPPLDEMLEALFGPENGAPVPTDMAGYSWPAAGNIEPRVAPTWQSPAAPAGMDVSFIAIGPRQLRHRSDPWLEREAEWLAERAEREGGTPGPLAPQPAPAPAFATGGYFVPGSLVFEPSQPQIDEMTANAAALLGTLPTLEFTISGFFEPQMVSVWIDEWVHARYRPPGWTAQDSRMRSAYRRRSLARRRRGRR